MPPPDQLDFREFLHIVVQAAHQGILARMPDPSWHEAFVTELMRRAETTPPAEVATQFVRIINESPEAQNRALTQLAGRTLEPLVAPALAARPAPLPCISAGCTPRAAGMLRRAGLRRWAGPFDWMTIPAAAIRDCLTDDFATLMAPRHHQALAPEPGTPGHLARHARFSDLYGETLFHRADPTTPEGYAALERATLRLRDSLRGLHGKLLLQLTEEEPETPRLFAETAAMLDRLSRGAALVTIAIVEGPPDGPFPEMELAESRGAHRLLRCRPLSRPQGTAFADPMDELVMLRGAISTATDLPA